MGLEEEKVMVVVSVDLEVMVFETGGGEGGGDGVS